MYDLIFYLFAVIAILSALVVAFVRKIAHAAFALLFTFFGVAGIYVLLGADFVGVAQILIYVGGILVLILFGMMLTSNVDRMSAEEMPMKRSLWAIAGTSALASVLLTIIWTNPIWNRRVVDAPKMPAATTSPIGRLLVGEYSLLFVAVGVAMLVALVGAAMIARSDRHLPEDAAERM